VADVSQEHGIITRRPGSVEPVPDLPVGTLLRILPNHACATASQFDHYAVVPEGEGAALKRWSRIRGW
jgi:D-serine deaminase-like pyridoxal phosphate-dependent protein